MATACELPGEELALPEALLADPELLEPLLEALLLALIEALPADTFAAAKAELTVTQELMKILAARARQTLADGAGLDNLLPQLIRLFIAI
jgi:hypothetical protein